MTKMDGLPAEIRDRLTTAGATPHARAVRRDFSRRVRDCSGQEVLKVATALVAYPGWKPHFVAFELVLHHPAARKLVNEALLNRFGKGLDSWGAVDTFGCYLAGPAWRAGQVADAEILRRARSDDLWWRRAALVSTVPLNNKTQGGAGEARRTLTVCVVAVADREDMVVKALSWALRELAKCDPQAVVQFLSDHDGRLAARVVREVQNKLTTGKKNPRRPP